MYYIQLLVSSPDTEWHVWHVWHAFIAALRIVVSILFVVVIIFEWVHIPAASVVTAASYCSILSSQWGLGGGGALGTPLLECL